MALNMSLVNEPYYKPILQLLRNNHIYYPKYSDNKYITFLSGEDRDFMNDIEYHNLTVNYISPSYFTKFFEETSKFIEPYFNFFRNSNKHLTEIQQLIDFNHYKYELIYCLLYLDNNKVVDRNLFEKIMEYMNLIENNKKIDLFNTIPKS